MDSADTRRTTDEATQMASETMREAGTGAVAGTDRNTERNGASGADAAGRPNVSIIVPVYNAEKGIRRCLDSILGQEYRDVEVLLVDDGSTDAGPVILDEYAAADPRVRVWHRQNSGVSATRNFALDHARGRWIQFLDADDWITEDATKLLVRAGEENSADMVIADFYRVVGSDVAVKGQMEQRQTLMTREEYADEMMKSPADFYYGVIWNKLYRHDIIDRYGLRMDERLNWCEDFIFNLEYVLHVDTVFPLHSPIYYYVKTEGSLVSRSDVSDTVRMKHTVLQYYRNFYKDVFDEDEYKRRRADIYRYLVAFATDDAAISVMPGTTKLGDERVLAYVPDGMEANPFLGVYYAVRILDRYLDRVAEQNDLPLRQVRILAYLHYGRGAVDMVALSDFIGQSRPATMLDLQRLDMGGWIDVTWSSANEPSVEFTEKGRRAALAIDHACDDFQSLFALDDAAWRHVYDVMADALAQTTKALVRATKDAERQEEAERKAAKREAKQAEKIAKQAEKIARQEAKQAAKIARQGARQNAEAVAGAESTIHSTRQTEAWL